MTDEEIKKGYFICRINIEGNCDICPFNKGVNDCSCIDDLNKAIIDLINRQQAEIERLQKKYDRAMDNLKAVLKERAGEQNV